jgi:hypothetical protein
MCFLDQGVSFYLPVSTFKHLGIYFFDTTQRLSIFTSQIWGVGGKVGITHCGQRHMERYNPISVYLSSFASVRQRNYNYLQLFKIVFPQYRLFLFFSDTIFSRSFVLKEIKL